MNEARMNNGLSIVVERKKVNCGSYPSQGPMLILEHEDVELHLSRIFYTKTMEILRTEDIP